MNDYPLDNSVGFDATQLCSQRIVIYPLKSTSHWIYHNPLDKSILGFGCYIPNYIYPMISALSGGQQCQCITTYRGHVFLVKNKLLPLDENGQFL